MFDFSRFLTDNYAIALSAAMLVALIYLCLYYGLFHFRVGKYRHKESHNDASAPSPLPPVSVVLTAHNDADWLKENLVYLLEQDYPDFEVVVIDYLSRDDTPSVLKLLKDYYPHLKVVPFVGNITVREGVASHEDVNLFQGKKYPLSIGIKSAKNDILLLADPDCTPRNLMWLRGMVQGYNANENKTSTDSDGKRNHIQIVLGFCGLKPTKSLLGALQQYDNLSYSAHYLGNALLGHPYTGSGRNLSYRRSFFFKQGAFISHYDIADGSDDLFVYQNANRHNTAICINDNACLNADPKKTFAAWHEERVHRVATRSRHNFWGRAAEQLLPICNVVFYASAVLLILSDTAPSFLPLALLAIKWAWQIFCFSTLTSRFTRSLVHWLAPILEIYFIIANTILILLPLHSNRKFKK